MTSEHLAVKEFTIPRRGAVTQRKEAKSKEYSLEDVPVSSDDFKSVYSAIFFKNLSIHQKDRNINITRCQSIHNFALQEKFKLYQKQLEQQSQPSDVSYCFLRIVGPNKEIESIARYGLHTGNSFIGDLGDSLKGVHLNESPDLVTPCQFYEKTRIRIMAFKVLKGRSNVVGLSSFKLSPTNGYSSHIARPSVNCDQLNRHELFRYDQVYLYEECEIGQYACVPSNILPFAVLFVEFPPNVTTTFKYIPITVWSGTLKVADKCHQNVVLQSIGSVFIKPPFLERVFEITKLVNWKSCLEYPPIIDLLSHQIVGKLCIKREMSLPTVKRLATYFILRSQQDDTDSELSDMHELMRVASVAAISVLSNGSTILLIPNSEFSSLLSLHCKDGQFFHCLHFSKTCFDSLLYGSFEVFNADDLNEFNRLPNVTERINGQSTDVKNVIEELCDSSIENSNVESDDHHLPKSSVVKSIPKHPDATPPNLSSPDMDIEGDSDNDDDKGNDTEGGLSKESNKNNLDDKSSIAFVNTLSKSTTDINKDATTSTVVLNRADTSSSNAHPAPLEHKPLVASNTLPTGTNNIYRNPRSQPITAVNDNNNATTNIYTAKPIIPPISLNSPTSQPNQHHNDITTPIPSSSNTYQAPQVSLLAKISHSSTLPSTTNNSFHLSNDAIKKLNEMTRNNDVDYRSILPQFSYLNHHLPQTVVSASDNSSNCASTSNSNTLKSDAPSNIDRSTHDKDDRNILFVNDYNNRRYHPYQDAHDSSLLSPPRLLHNVPLPATFTTNNQPKPNPPYSRNPDRPTTNFDNNSSQSSSNYIPYSTQHPFNTALPLQRYSHSTDDRYGHSNNGSDHKK